MPFRGPEYPEAPDLPQSGFRFCQIRLPPHQKPAARRTYHRVPLPSPKMKCRTSAFRQHPVKAVPPARSSTCHDTVQMLSPAPGSQSECEPHTGLHHTLSAQNGSPHHRQPPSS